MNLTEKLETAIWKSKCHAKRNKFLINALLFVPMILLFAVPIAIHFMGFGTVAAILLILCLTTLIWVIVYVWRLRWVNPKLIFALTNEAIIFTAVGGDNSYFYEEYANIAEYDSIEEPDGTANVTVFFKVRTHAGVFGKIKSLKMIKIENYAQLKDAFKLKSVPHRIKNK